MLSCTHHLLVISNTPHLPYYPQLSFRTYWVDIICILSCICYVHTTAVICRCTCHPHLSICVLCAHYPSLIYSFLIDNADVIHMSSLVLFIYPIMYNLVSAQSAQTHIVHVICMLSTHVHIICLSSLTLLIYPIIHNLVSHIVHTLSIICILSADAYLCHVLIYCCYLHCHPHIIWAAH